MDTNSDDKPTVLEQRQAMLESGELQRRVVQELLTPQAVEAIGAFLESPQLKQLVTFQKALVGGVTEFLQKPEVQAGISNLGEFLSSPQVGAVLRAMGKLSLEADQLTGSTVADYLHSRRGQGSGRVVEGAGVASISIRAYGEGRVISAEERALESQIVQKLEVGGSRLLTGDQLKRLGIVVAMILALYNFIAQWNSVREGVCDLNSRFGPTTTLADVRRAVRLQLCGAPAAFVRIVSRDNVNLRSAPGIKAKVITQLPKGLAVAVVSRDDRDWLEVSFERDGYVIEGWVSRKYLAKVR